MKTVKAFLLIISALYFVATATAQGFPSFTPQDCHAYDCVNLSSNAVMLQAPIFSKAGAIAANTSLSGASYVAKGGVNGNTWLSAMSFTVATNDVLYSATVQTHSGNITNSATNCTGGSPATTKYSGWYVAMPDGTHHPLPTADYVDMKNAGGSCLNSTFTDTTTDNSGLTATITVSGSSFVTTVTNSAGMQLWGGTSSNQIIDANSNSIQLASGTLTDTLGVTAVTEAGTFPTKTYTWTDVNAGSPVVTETDSSLTFYSAFTGARGGSCTGSTDANNAAANELTGLTFADGRSLTWTYEATPGHAGNYTGRLGTITLPESGTIAYTYSGGSNGLDCTYWNPPVLTRTLGNGDVSTYTLTHPQIGTSANYQAVNTRLDPGGNKSVYTFTGFTSTGVSATYDQVITEVQKWQGNGTTLLTTDLYSYNTAFTSSPSATTISQAQVTLPITKLIVYHQINGMSNWSASETHFDTYGNTTYSASYDFGGSSPAIATTITYGSCTASCTSTTPTISNTAMAANNIYNRPGEVVTAQSGSNVAQANFTYDSKGNLTSKQAWTGSSFIGQTSSNTYNSNGTPIKTFDLANNESDYTYDTTKYSDTCGSSLNPVFATKITNVGTGLATQATFDCTGAVKLTDVDANGNTTTYGYTISGVADPYWRVGTITDPYSAVVKKSYPNSLAPTMSTSAFTFNSSNSMQGSVTMTDAYGRVVDAQRAQSPTSFNYDTVSTSYGWSGNYAQVQTSEPCSVTGSGTACSSYAHTSTFDPLGRLHTVATTSNETITNTYSQNDALSVLTPAPSGENSKQAQTEYDGLGRVKYVCHIGSTASTGSGTACSQNTGSANGVTDAFTYGQGTGYTTVTVKRNGTQTRTNTYDALGRLTSKLTPEGGTWSYAYDTTAAACSASVASKGNLTCTSDPDGNGIAYFYDSMNRITKQNANGTTCRHFYYDASYGTVPTGVTTPVNTLGRLAEDSTDDCAGTLVTDEWHSYDQDGREADFWESTLHSTQYYHSIATFYDNGAIKSLQLASPSLYTINYGLEGEGRYATLKNGSSTVVAGPTTVGGMYDPAGHVLNVQLTGTTPDQDIYTYDSNTGRMKTFEFEVGNTPANLTGTITWNANGTVAHVGVVDGFNAGGSSTCYSDSNSSLGYGYDDWGRLMSFDCGSGNVGENYSYDIYDNLNMAIPTGRTGWILSTAYSSSTNRMTGDTYDSNGNTTADGGSNTYGYNEFSKVKWTATSGTPTCGSGGKCVTYDAFGRMVETSNGSTWVELWYPQMPGSRVTMSGTSQSFAYWPSPGKGIYAPGSSAFFMHQDWLGNDRIASSISNHTVSADRDYTPYGQQFNSFGGTNPLYGMFASMPGDYNAGTLSDTPNREFALNQIRWISPDPVGSGWNQYAYSTNPNSQIDPSGLNVCAPAEAGGCGWGKQGGGDTWGYIPLSYDGFNSGQDLGPTTVLQGNNPVLSVNGQPVNQINYGATLSLHGDSNAWIFQTTLSAPALCQYFNPSCRSSLESNSYPDPAAPHWVGGKNGKPAASIKMIAIIGGAVVVVTAGMAALMTQIENPTTINIGQWTIQYGVPGASMLTAFDLIWDGAVLVGGAAMPVLSILPMDGSHQSWFGEDGPAPQTGPGATCGIACPRPTLRP